MQNFRAILGADDDVVDPVEEDRFRRVRPCGSVRRPVLLVVNFFQVEVDNVVLLVGQELVVTVHPPAWLVALLFQPVEDQLGAKGDDFDWQRELTELVDQLAFVNDPNDLVGGIGNDLFPEEGATATLDSLKSSLTSSAPSMHRSMVNVINILDGNPQVTGLLSRPGEVVTPMMSVSCLPEPVTEFIDHGGPWSPFPGRRSCRLNVLDGFPSRLCF